MSALFELVAAAANNVVPYPGEDIALDYLTGVVWTLFLGLGIAFWPVPARDRRALGALWGAKALMVLVFTLAFENRYGLDADGYFTNAVSTGFVWEGFHLANGTRTMWNLAWLQNHLTPGSYHASKASFAMLGLVSVYLIYRAGVLFLGREDRRILFALALFPSSLFWSSMLTKDPAALFAMALYVYGVARWHVRGSARSLLWAALGGLVVAFVRLWLVPIMVVPLIVMNAGSVRFLRRRVLWLPVMAVVLFAAVVKLREFWGINAAADLLEFRSYATTAFEGGSSSRWAPEITSFGGVARLAPWAVFTALFRPLPGEVPSLFGFLQGLDNLALLGLLSVAALRTRLRELAEPMVLWALSLVTIWGLLYGLVAYNFGSLVRYKLTVLPVLLGLLLYLARRRRSEPAGGGSREPLCAE